MTVATGSGFGSKPRPALIVQDDAYLDISTILVALISSDDRALRLSVSVTVEPSATNGLHRRLYVTIHELVTVRLEKLDKHIGRMDDTDLRRVDQALLTFLGLTIR